MGTPLSLGTITRLLSKSFTQKIAKKNCKKRHETFAKNMEKRSAEYLGMRTPEPIRREYLFDLTASIQQELEAGEEMLKQFFDEKTFDGEHSREHFSAKVARFENKR